MKGLKWARENQCPWYKRLCKDEAKYPRKYSIVDWIRENQTVYIRINGSPLNGDNDNGDDDDGDDDDDNDDDNDDQNNDNNNED